MQHHVEPIEEKSMRLTLIDNIPVVLVNIETDIDRDRYKVEGNLLACL